MRRLLLILLLACAVLSLSAAAAVAKKPEERVVIKGSVLVDRGETTKDVVVIDGDAVIRGKVRGNVVVVKGKLAIRGTVTGDVVTIADRATLGRRAKVNGDVRYVDKKPKLTPGATVAGKVKRLNPDKLKGPGIGAIAGFWLAVSVSAFLLGILLLLLAPRAADGVVAAARGRGLRAILLGLLLFFLIPILGVVFLVTIVGIPLGVGLLLAVPVLYSLAYVTSAWLLGRRILKTRPRILAFLVGLIVLRLLALIPFVGGLVWFVATILGLGVLFVSMRRGARATA
ncbi:MAG: polymer-forming cytoskeletal protein [Actinomycetota bacterium]|nr:polymer-forming cytoskeletal protein [Actinomycetota bacterium]